MAAPTTICPVISAPGQFIRCTDVVNKGLAPAIANVNVSPTVRLHFEAVVDGAAGNDFTVACTQLTGVSTPVAIAFTTGALTIGLPTGADEAPAPLTLAAFATAWTTAAISDVVYAVEKGADTDVLAVFAEAAFAGGSDARGCTMYDGATSACKLKNA